MPDIPTWIATLLGFANDRIMPFLVAVMTVWFLWNLTRYFIIQSGSEDGRTKARLAATYGFMALIFVVAFWGIINLLTGAVNLSVDSAPCPDYNPNCNGAFGP